MGEQKANIPPPRALRRMFGDGCDRRMRRPSESGPDRQLAILPPPRRVMATMAGRGGTPSVKSGHRVDGSSKVEGRLKAGHSSPSSPGCCTATNMVSSSGVNTGPHISAPTGQRKKCFEVPRKGPSVSTAQTPSLRRVVMPELPSVVIHRRPMLSKAQLSGMPNQPSLLVADEKVAPTSAIDGSPHFSMISQAKRVEA